MIRDCPQNWPVASSVELATGQLVRVRRDMVRMPDGSLAAREIVEHPGAVAVLALDDDDRVLLIRQYRHPVGRLLWEIPAGLRDVRGEPLLATAQRELTEEAGYRAADWRVLVDFFTSPGFSNERLRIFLARQLTEIPAAERVFVPEHEEAHLVIRWQPLDRAVAGLLSGDLHNGVTAVGVLAARAARASSFAGLRDAAAAET
jgi:8-oxo-dGDP phosphatase